MRAGAFLLCGAAIAATAYAALRGGGEPPPASTKAAPPAVTIAPALVLASIPFEDAKPILDARPQEVPPDLKSTPAADRAAA